MSALFIEGAHSYFKPKFDISKYSLYDRYVHVIVLLNVFFREKFGDVTNNAYFCKHERDKHRKAHKIKGEKVNFPTLYVFTTE